MIAAIDLLEPRNHRIARWMGAAMLISAIHVGGGGFAMLYWQDALVEESPGAIVVEIAPVATTVTLDPHELPPGQLSEEATATQSVSTPKVEKTKQDAPEEDLPSPAVDPAVTLQKPTVAEDKPKEEPKEEASELAKVAEQQVAAAKTTAPTRIAGEISTKAAAPQAGTSTAATRSIVSWQNSVVLHLNRHKRYPAEARQNNMQGVVRIHFTMDRSGQLTASDIAQSSGFALLDQEALELLKRASPLPRPPPAVIGELLELVVPIQFRINK